MAEFAARLLRKLPKQPQTVVVTCAYALAAGAAAVAFQMSINVLYNAGFVRLSHSSPAKFIAGTFVVTTASSLIVGWLLSSFCSEAAGSGIPQLKLAFWKEFGLVPWRAVWVKYVAGALSIGGGSSLGREGPSVHLAGGLASVMAGFFGEPKQNRRRAAAAGAAAGLAAAFNTPIASITFVLEEIMEDLNSRFLGSVLLASVIGAMVVHGMIGQQPAFTLRGVNSPTWISYVLVPLVAAAAAIVGLAFQKSTLALRGPHRLFPSVPRWARPMIGALITWCMGIAVFFGTGHLGVFALGYDDLSAALANHITWGVAAVLLATKLIATIVCYGFGGCGGIFSPTLFLGGMTGVAIAGLAALGLHIPNGDQTVLAVVGMSACLGAVVGAPVTGILIVFEMTHEFSLVPALMLGALVSQAIRRWLSPHNFYEEVLLQDGHNLEAVIPPRDLHDWQQLPVSAIANFQPLMMSGSTAEDLRKILEQPAYSRFPIASGSEVRGILSRHEAQAALVENREARLDPAVFMSPREPIRQAQNALLQTPSSMVLIRDGPSGPILGLVTLHDLLRAQLAFADKKA
jgi:CIC family chloride channel protein